MTPMTAMPTIAGSTVPRSRRSRWMRPSTSGSSSHATAYRSTKGAPSTAATAMIPRTMIGSMPSLAATPAETPPSQPWRRGTPRRRSHAKKPSPAVSLVSPVSPCDEPCVVDGAEPTAPVPWPPSDAESPFTSSCAAPDSGAVWFVSMPRCSQRRRPDRYREDP